MRLRTRDQATTQGYGATAVWADMIRLYHRDLAEAKADANRWQQRALAAEERLKRLS